MWLARILFVVACAAGCYAQEYEAGGAIGYGLYTKHQVIAPAGTVDASIRNRFVLGVVVTQNMYERVSGDLRYTYQDGDPFLSAGNTRTNLNGQSHALHYDFLFHFRPRSERIRPYIAAGAGIKLYVVSGPDNPNQPFTAIAVLKSTDQLKALATPGAGVSIRLRPDMLLRLDFRDYITTFPRQIIRPAPFGTARGIFQQFTPMIGISYAFY